MGFVLIIVAVVLVIVLLKTGGRATAGEEPMPTALCNPDAGTPRRTSRRKLREILASEQYESLTDWEKTFCNDVNHQKTRLTWAQADKIDEIWSGINESLKWDKQYQEQCKTAFKSLKEIIESPAFQTLPDKEQKYMLKIYDGGEVSGSYRIRRIQEVHGRIIGGGGSSK
jgi:hypothetical protein